jgi:ubiquinol-cytochrome c reductase iron-sulfur subunit
VRAAWRWLVALLVLLLARRGGRGRRADGRLLPRAPGGLLDELLVLALLGGAALGALGFIVGYVDGADTQLLGLALGSAFVFLGAAAAVTSRRLVPQETLSEPKPPLPEPEAEEQVDRLVEEGAERLSRRRLLVAAGGTAGVLGAALVLPLASLGPSLGDRLIASRWRRGLRLVDEAGRPLGPEDIPPRAFVTAFPEGADRHALGSPLVLVRLAPDELELPAGRDGWAPEGVLAFSKICPHAGCAISLYRTPLYEPQSSRPALVCPCHFSTFDVRRGGERIFGPAARDLPQLPLAIDGDGRLVADGDFSAPPGPGWSGIG